MSKWVSEWVSSFLKAHKHTLGYSVFYDGVEDITKDKDIIKAI